MEAGWGGKRWVGVRWGGGGRRREHRSWAGRQRREGPKGSGRPGGRGGEPSQEGGVRSPQPPCGEGLQEFRGGRGPSRARGPTSTAPGLRQPPARRRARLPGALARGGISRSHCPESFPPTSGPSLAHTAQPPGVQLGRTSSAPRRPWQAPLHSDASSSEVSWNLTVLRGEIGA